MSYLPKFKRIGLLEQPLKFRKSERESEREAEVFMNINWLEIKREKELMKTRIALSTDNRLSSFVSVEMREAEGILSG